MLRFSLFGYSVRVEWFFWILCLILGSRHLQGPDPAGGLIKLLIITAVVFGSILFHELGHAWARKRSGAPYSDIVLHGFGGYCTGPGQFTRGQHIFIAAAGPLASLLLGGITMILAQTGIFSSELLKVLLKVLLFWLLWVNIGWALLNLLPIYPLDGGQIFAGIAGPKYQRIVLWIGVLLPVAIAVLGALNGPQYFLVIMFGLLAFQNWQRLKGEQPRFPGT